MSTRIEPPPRRTQATSTPHRPRGPQRQIGISRHEAHPDVALTWHVGYSRWEGWIALSIILYLFTGALWEPVVFMQMRMRDLAIQAVSDGKPLPDAYFRLFRIWFAFGFSAFAAVAVIVWLMIARPQIDYGAGGIAAVFL